jgi:hypothetical protein
LAPPAKSGTNGGGDCLEFCKEQAICMCAKILGGSLRLTKCNILAQCVDTVNPGSHCECEVDPICVLWEKDLVVQAAPPGDPGAPCDPCEGCPCDFFAMPFSESCWPTNELRTFVNDTDPPTTACFINSNSNLPSVRSSSGLLLCVAGHDSLPDCPAVPQVNGLTDQEVAACRTCLEEYATALNSAGFTVGGGPPYICQAP